MPLKAYIVGITVVFMSGYGALTLLYQLINMGIK